MFGSIISQTRFHVLVLAKNSYFLYVVIGSTLSMCFLQVLAAYTTHLPLSSHIWIRAILVALWSMTLASVGIIGYQRFQGTLPYLFSGSYTPIEVLVPLLCALLVFSCGAFPCAVVCCVLLHIPLTVPHPFWTLIGLGLVLLAFSSIEMVCAALGVLTPRALIYEEVINIPVMLCLGIFPLPRQLGFCTMIGHLIPGNDAIAIINLSEQPAFHVMNCLIHVCISLGITAIWVALGYIFAHKAVKYATQTGTIGIT